MYGVFRVYTTTSVLPDSLVVFPSLTRPYEKMKDSSGHRFKFLETKKKHTSEYHQYIQYTLTKSSGLQ